MLSWKRLEEVARCITRRRGAAIRYRDFETRSFIERGGVSGDIDGK
jgi:hypothetical protein